MDPRTPRRRRRRRQREEEDTNIVAYPLPEGRVAPSTPYDLFDYLWIERIMSSPAIGLAETIQTASLKHHPSPAHDINPSTSASKKHPISSDAASISSGAVDPSRTFRPLSRHSQLPPLPDLRFEQSYLNSLNGAESWGRIAWITIRDQVFLPLIQGTLWSLARTGFRFWNRGAKFSGRTLGSKIRRWWWNVNNWKIPGPADTPELAENIQDYYESQFANAAGD